MYVCVCYFQTGKKTLEHVPATQLPKACTLGYIKNFNNKQLFIMSLAKECKEHLQQFICKNHCNFNLLQYVCMLHVILFLRSICFQLDQLQVTGHCNCLQMQTLGLKTLVKA